MLPPAVEKEEGGGPPQSCNHRLPRSREGREWGMVERGRKEEGGEVPCRRRGWGRGPSSSGSLLAAVEGEQGAGGGGW